jgi:hypothetical protein
MGESQKILMKAIFLGDPIKSRKVWIKQVLHKTLEEITY